VANLTLTIDDAVLKRARIRALELDTSVNALVRDYLESFADAGRTAAARQRLLELVDLSEAGHHDSERTWTREDIYEERLRWPRS